MRSRDWSGRRSNEKRDCKMRAAPDCCRHLANARVRTQLPALLSKESSHCGCAKWSTSSNTEENLAFWIDDAAKTIAFADGTPLTVKRFDERWISAARGDVSYEFDRQRGNVAYAGTTMKDGTATIII